jgi:ribonuclease-3
VIADKLLTSYPEENEGALAMRLAALASAPTLASVAEGIDLAPYIKLAPGQQADATESAILADACEAVIGALFLDGGLEAASIFITAKWEPLMRAEIVPPKDPKTALQEWSQGHRLALPTYKLVSESGPAHAPAFTISVMVGGFAAREGQGRTKRFAEQAAAEALLETLPGIS